jgi:hypothetical protein
LLHHDPTSVLEAEASASDSRQALLTLLQAGAYLATGVGFLVWFHAHLWWALYLAAWVVDRTEADPRYGIEGSR